MAKDIFGFNTSSKPVNFGLGGSSKTTNKRKAISGTLREQVWFKYIGGKKAEAKCYCCRIRTIHITDFQVGHNKAVAKGGKNNISNLRPICGKCNRGMGTKSIEWYKKKYFDKPTTKKTTTKKTKTKSAKPKKPANPFGGSANFNFKLPKF